MADEAVQTERPRSWLRTGLAPHWRWLAWGLFASVWTAALLTTALVQARNSVVEEDGLRWALGKAAHVGAYVFLVVLTIFGIPRTPVAILAIPVTMLIGVAFSSCLFAFTATQKNDVGFSAVFRFVINPLFLFSGTFFPLSQLPDAIEWIAWLTPLFHGVELVRGLILDNLNWAVAPIHLAYLLVMTAIGVVLADRFLHRRMAG